MPIIVVTGTNWQTPTEVFRTLRKPIGSDVLVTTIEQALVVPAARFQKPSTT